jgi:hypothetical protein
MQSFTEDNHSVHASSDRLMRSEYEVDISGFIGQAWELFKQEPGKYIGYSLVVIVIYLIEQVFGNMFDPEKLSGGYQDYSSGIFWIQLLVLLVISIFLSLLTIPLYAGVNVVGFKQMSDQEVKFGDFFHGYHYWASLIASALAQGVIVFIVIGIAVIAGSLVLGMFWNTSQHLIATLLIMLIIVLSLVSLIYIAVIYIFSQMLIIDRRFGFWQSMEMSRKVVTQRWFSVFALMIVTGLLNLLGAVALIVGLLVTFPLSYLTLSVAYREIFGLEGSDW